MIVTTIVSLHAPPHSSRPSCDKNRHMDESHSIASSSRRAPERIPLASPIISKRITGPKRKSNGSNNNKRRVIFPFIPKTFDDSSVTPASTRYPPCTLNAAASEECTTGPLEIKIADPIQESLCEVWDNVACDKKTAGISAPFLSNTRPVDALLLPRESTLSSHDENQSEVVSVTFQTQDSVLEDEEASHPPAKNDTKETLANPSILKSSRKLWCKSSDLVETLPSVESNLPSLASSSQSDSHEDQQRKIFQVSELPRRSKTALSSTGSFSPTKSISFDPRIWVREFERSTEEYKSTWYSSRDLENFKVAAVERIVAFSETELIPTGTGRMIPKQKLTMGKCMFSHKALGSENEVKKESLFRAVLKNEMRRILIVDSHEIFLKLFAKTLRPLLPHAEIVLADSAAAALSHTDSGRFDLILVEERLKSLSSTTPSASYKQERRTLCGFVPTDLQSRSGSALIKFLQGKHTRSLYIGVSAKLREDMPTMSAVADVCWSKPPPHMNAGLIRELLRMLLLKRQRFQAISEIYSTKNTC